MSALSIAVGPRLREALKAERPVHTAKLVAGDLGVQEVTVKKWLAGNAPSSRHLLALFRRYGAGFAASVLAPCGDWAELLRLEAEREALRRRFEALEAEWRRATGTDLSGRPVAALPAGQAAGGEGTHGHLASARKPAGVAPLSAAAGADRPAAGAGGSAGPAAGGGRR